jgi:hypothetical protein
MSPPWVVIPTPPRTLMLPDDFSVRSLAVRDWIVASTEIFAAETIKSADNLPTISEALIETELLKVITPDE